MLIQCKSGECSTLAAGEPYNFVTDQYGRAVCNVSKTAHIAVFLAVVDQYKEVPRDPTKPIEKAPDLSADDAEMAAVMEAAKAKLLADRKAEAEKQDAEDDARLARILAEEAAEKEAAEKAAADRAVQAAKDAAERRDGQQAADAAKLAERDAAKAAKAKPIDRANEQQQGAGAGEPDKEEAPDGSTDLTKIKGIGDVMMAKLNTYDIFTLEQIAGLTETDIGILNGGLDLKGAIERDGWVDQAAKLIAEG